MARRLYGKYTVSLSRRLRFDIPRGVRCRECGRLVPLPDHDGENKRTCKCGISHRMVAWPVAATLETPAASMTFSGRDQYDGTARRVIFSPLNVRTFFHIGTANG